MQMFFSFLTKLAKKQLNKKLFNSLNYTDKLNYLNQHFIKIGTGTSRVTFLINSSKVIKLALNNPGLAQNKIEFDNLLKFNSKFLPKAFDKSPDSSWIEVEFILPVKNTSVLDNYFNAPPNSFKKLFHLQNFYRISSFNDFLTLKNKIPHLFDNPKFIEFYSFLFNSFPDSIHDFFVESNTNNYGIINDQLKVIDLGFDLFVSNIFYPIKNSNPPDLNTDPILQMDGYQRNFIPFKSKDPNNQFSTTPKIFKHEPKLFNSQITKK